MRAARRPLVRAQLDMPLGEVVRRLRLERGITQEQLAYASHIQVGHISRLENGRGNPRLSTLEALAASLGLALHELLAAAEAQAQSERP